MPGASGTGNRHISERHAATQGRNKRGARSEGAAKLLRPVSRELIAQGAPNGCLKIVDNSQVATAKQKPAVEDDKQLHQNFITWEDVSPVHCEFWFDRMEASMSQAALVKVWKLAKPVKIQFCKQLMEFTTGRKPSRRLVM